MILEGNYDDIYCRTRNLGVTEEGHPPWIDESVETPKVSVVDHVHPQQLLQIHVLIGSTSLRIPAGIRVVPMVKHGPVLSSLKLVHSPLQIEQDFGCSGVDGMY
ncbi:hypothetical protein EmuJ_000421600 [Echinococcus multilocularis]|uniref:Uncharacterized protein n=1 Tax=Echinococcus multilocularis TaxID=6211 RepID=A0A068Y489_ECHMU|nr:hypothetical protein EmuJ_000421600 [Echinococcus multilocularis]